MSKPSNESCSNCKYGCLGNSRQLECRARPPTVQIIMMVKDDKPAPITFTAWGIVNPEGWCGHWTPSIALVQ